MDLNEILEGIVRDDEPELVFFYEEDFEDTDGDYTVSGYGARWEWGTPTVWPESAASGDKCWGTDLNGNYSNGADETLTSPVIQLTGVEAGSDLVIEWMQALYIESSSWDNAYVELSLNGGSWMQMWAHTGSTVQVPWELKSYTIESYNDEDIQLRFRITTDGSVTYSGLYIDDVTISESK